ncbi:hypothetical protein GCM10010431_64560 [Streptomyces kunmingensis]
MDDHVGERQPLQQLRGQFLRTLRQMGVRHQQHKHAPHYPAPPRPRPYRAPLSAAPARDLAATDNAGLSDWDHEMSADVIGEMRL